MRLNIAVLPGDGIGPEVTEAAMKVLEAVCPGAGITLQTEQLPFGGAAIDETGDPLPATTLDACRKADAVFLGAVGGPKWDKGPARPEAGLLGLRKALGLYANLRPSRLFRGLEDLSPLKAERAEGTDVLVVRELTGGLYFGERREGDEEALDTLPYARGEVERVARIAFEAARGRSRRLASADKANVLATSRLWRRTVEGMAADYPDVEVEHVLVDAMAMHLVTQPSRYDVIVTENLFGDILSDELAAVTGSLGLSPSASLGAPGGPGLFEPIHGSAPDIAGHGTANPIAAILSAALLLRLGADAPEAAARIERAVEDALAGGTATPDLGGTANTKEMTDSVLSRL